MATTNSHSERVLRLDSKGRVGILPLVRKLQAHFGDLSGFAARIENGEIILSPRVERDPLAPDTLVLNDADRDAFLAALANPPAPNAKLKKAAARYRRDVTSR